MKRIFTLLLCAAMLVTLAACSRPAPTDDNTVATVPTSVPTDGPTESTRPDAAPDVIRLVDNEHAAVFITGFNQTQSAGMEIQIRCVNKTDRALMFSWNMVSVCGYMYDPMWAVEVAGGKTANSVIELDTYALAQMGITSVDEITFTLRIMDSENWMDAPIIEEAFTVYPTGLNAETLILPQRTASASDAVVADDENIRFIIEGAEDSPVYTLRVYLENKTDRNLMYAWDKVSVNGFMVDPFWAVSVAAGKKAFSEITFSRSDFENSGITEVSEIEFTLQVSDYDDWVSDYLLEETYTYNP